MPDSNANLSWLLFTDLDGSLLDHHDYSHEPVDELLPRLRDCHIPVVFNSSKTAVEIDRWRRELSNRDPFIVENGSAIYIPHDYFPRAPDSAVRHGDYLIVELGYRREYLVEWLNAFQFRHACELTHYARASMEQIMQYTGLNEADARQSMDRHYSEPILWRQDEQLKQLLLSEAAASGLQVLQGGRFLHLLGNCDKGRASLRLIQEYTRAHTPIKQPNDRPAFTTLALGDSGNDIAMFQAADYAGVIRSPVHLAPAFEHPRKYLSKGFGPSGWRELVEALALKAEL